MPDIIAKGDKKVLSDLRREYDRLVDEKFYLMEQRDSLMFSRRPFTHLTLTIQDISSRMIHIDARVNSIRHIPHKEHVPVPVSIPVIGKHKYNGDLADELFNRIVDIVCTEYMVDRQDLISTKHGYILSHARATAMMLFYQYHCHPRDIGNRFRRSACTVNNIIYDFDRKCQKEKLVHINFENLKKIACSTIPIPR